VFLSVVEMSLFTLQHKGMHKVNVKAKQEVFQF